MKPNSQRPNKGPVFFYDCCSVRYIFYISLILDLDLADVYVDESCFEFSLKVRDPLYGESDAESWLSKPPNIFGRVTRKDANFIKNIIFIIVESYI